MGIIQASHDCLNPVTIMGEQGGDLRVVRVVQGTDVGGGIMVVDMELLEGVFTTASWADIVANHGDTIRWSMTLPSNVMAIIQSAFFYIARPSSGKECRLRFRAGGVTIFGLFVVYEDSMSSARTLNWTGRVVIPPGSTLELRSYSTDTTAREFNATVNFLAVYRR